MTPDTIYWFYMPKGGTYPRQYWHPMWAQSPFVTEDDLEYMKKRFIHRILPFEKGPRTPPDDAEKLNFAMEKMIDDLT